MKNTKKKYAIFQSKTDKVVLLIISLIFSAFVIFASFSFYIVFHNMISILLIITAIFICLTFVIINISSCQPMIFEEGYFAGGLLKPKNILDSTVPIHTWKEIEKISLGEMTYPGLKPGGSGIPTIKAKKIQIKLTNGKIEFLNPIINGESIIPFLKKKVKKKMA